VLSILNGSLIRVWTLASYTTHREFGAVPGERIAFARWRPGTDDIVVSVADRLEIWPMAGGDRRIVAQGLSIASGLLVSTDGALAFLTFDLEGTRSRSTWRRIAAPLPISVSQLVAYISFR